jgi:hypothetical protein
MKTLTPGVVIAVAVGVTACSNSAARYVPVVDGPKDAAFSDDLSACQDLAEERSYLNGDTRSNALLTGGIGTVIGAAEEGIGGAIAGGLIGSVLGAGGTAWKARDERKAIVVDCMRGRGHQIVG